MIHLLPGPVQIAPEIAQTFAGPVLSHREDAFLGIYADLRNALQQLVPNTRCALMMGSGTLANDAVAAIAKTIFGDQPGLVLANGEFGSRLFGQALRAGLRYGALEWKWNEAWNFDQIARAIQRRPAWVWAVHLETSTGRLNPLHRLDRLCREHSIPLMADCVSSLGAVPFDGLSLFLTSGVSGKALGSYAGLALIFANEEALDRMQPQHLPSVFDIHTAIHTEAPRFTLGSPLVVALHTALHHYYGSTTRIQARFHRYTEVAALVREHLLAAQLPPLTQDHEASPVIATFALPTGIAESCYQAGYHIAHQSGYLQSRGWGQISVMGDIQPAMLSNLLPALVRSTTRLA